MALARRSSTPGKKKSKRRRSKHSTAKHLAKKAGIGTGVGMLISIPLTLAGRYFGRTELIEAGQRIGSIASTAAGGTPGNAGYQAADAIFDRFVVYEGGGVTGTRGQVYL